MRRALLAVTLLLLVQGCSADADPEAEAPTDDAAIITTQLATCPGPGLPATGENVLPNLSFPCLSGPGEMMLGRAPGVPTVLNLWAPWCEPCRDELPLFERLYAEAGDEVGVTGLVEKDTVLSAVTFASETDLRFPSAVDRTGELLSDQGLNGLPVTFFLRADGTIAHRQIGPIATYEELRALIGEHLGVDVPE